MSKNNQEKQESKAEISPDSKIESLKSQLDEYTAVLKRLQADFENYTKRVDKEKQELTKYASHKLVTKLLDVIDDFERTLQVTKDSEKKEVKEGIEMIYKQLNKILNEEGVKKIEAKGKKFDPYMHEVLDIVDGNENDLVIEELQMGYLLHDKVLRTSKVRISKVKQLGEN